MAATDNKKTKNKAKVLVSTKKNTRKKQEDKAYSRVKNYEDDNSFAEEESENTAQKTGKKPVDKKTKPTKEYGKVTKKQPVRAVEENPRNKKFLHQVMPYILTMLAVFMVVCFLLIDVFPGVKEEYGVGRIGRYIRNFFCGIFGFGAFFVPAVLAILALTWNRAVEKNCLLAKNLYALFSIISLSTLMHVIYATIASGADSSVGVEGIKISEMYRAGIALHGGGLVGGCLGELSRFGLGLTGSVIVTVFCAFVFCVFLVGLTPNYVVTAIRYRVKIAHEKRTEAMMARREEKAEEALAAKQQKEERKLAEQRERARKAAEQEAEKERLALEVEEKRAQRIALEQETQKAETEKGENLLCPVLEKPEEQISDETAQTEENETRDENILEKENQNTVENIGAVLEKDKEQERYLFKKKTVHPVKSILEEASDEEDEGFSLEEIFAEHGKEKQAADNVPSDQQPISSEVDVKILAEMKPISDIGELSEGVDDGIVEIIPEGSGEAKMKEYTFPPITLLAEDVSKKTDNMAELTKNAQKIQETLTSFNIRIKDIGYSRGPTITRYEIQPDAGVRVRSIANLVDDIALSLATTGVRIEAPIPNKPAVGVEVPNRNPETVYLRSLIESERFTNESSRLTACLGTDVGGHPIYFNIAKMPHLLIAGTTGSGKSVCINCIIMSLLYKARPDEVKLILIDPKKVEFSIYKDIPHLYAPIVSEPTKAAGTLASAVAEMERRFELIEEVGVRDIYSYNSVTKDDPDREFMPQMVIIIDELADLMMTAADSVETSICRLAQKARAAGIHLIVGTQRPSVDVITGLIKSNISSRIAFTVTSQVDSRTIIDIAGAEKLIGRGDMLFSPIGTTKPMRVQGAFVSDGEVEKVVEFVKANNSGTEYNEEFVNRIEEETAKCTAGKKGTVELGGEGGASADGLDPKFRAAVEIAVESGKISTSLLQRKLEIGYGRAAKIIDQMEETGYVSAPDGNKPRKILISKEDFMQMVVNGDIE